MPLTISVIVPTANRRPTQLARALTSVISQRRGRHVASIELLVVNASSGALEGPAAQLVADGTAREVALRAAANVSTARNAGARASVGEVIAFLDDDDVWLDGYLESCSAAMLEATVELVLCGFWLRGSQGQRRAGKQPDERSMSLQRLYLTNPGVTGSNIFVRREAFERLGGFDEQLETSNDKDFMIRFLADGGFAWRALRRRLVELDTGAPLRLSRAHPARVVSMRRFLALHGARMSPRVRETYAFNIALCDALTERSVLQVLKLIPRAPMQTPRLLRWAKRIVAGEPLIV